MSTQAPSAPEARLGQIVDGHYRLVEHLATGGMASVYRAEHINSRAPYAIKVLLKEHSDNAEIAARFQREVQAYRHVQHPHVVAAIDFGRLDDGCMYMVLEYMRGRDLWEILQREKPFSQARAVKIAFEVVQALVAAHAAGVVHRDLKPDNIMLVEMNGDPDYVKVVDFGIAKLTAARSQPLTALGSVFGTPEYMAPEQARGGTIDHRSDLYTLGTVLYEMLSGSTPFESSNIGQVIMAQLSKPPPPLPSSLDAELVALVMQLLEKDPAARVQTAAELASRLGSILARLEPGSPALTAAGGIDRFLAAPPPAVLAPAAAAAPLAPQSASMSARVVSVGAPAAAPAAAVSLPIAPAIAPLAAAAPVDAATPAVAPTRSSGCVFVAIAVGVLLLIGGAIVVAAVIWL